MSLFPGIDAAIKANAERHAKETTLPEGEEPPLFIKISGVEYVLKSYVDVERKKFQEENERLRNGFE